jgi:hypothetical protein
VLASEEEISDLFDLSGGVFERLWLLQIGPGFHLLQIHSGESLHALRGNAVVILMIAAQFRSQGPMPPPMWRGMLLIRRTYEISTTGFSKSVYCLRFPEVVSRSNALLHPTVQW